MKYSIIILLAFYLMMNVVYSQTRIDTNYITCEDNIRYYPKEGLYNIIVIPQSLIQEVCIYRKVKDKSTYSIRAINYKKDSCEIFDDECSDIKITNKCKVKTDTIYNNWKLKFINRRIIGLLYYFDFKLILNNANCKNISIIYLNNIIYNRATNELQLIH